MNDILSNIPYPVHVWHYHLAQFTYSYYTTENSGFISVRDGAKIMKISSSGHSRWRGHGSVSGPQVN